VLEVVGWLFAGGLIVYGLVRGSKFPKVPPRVTIARAAPGEFVRVVGRIVDGGSLVAPITGRTCVSFDAVVRHGGPRTEDAVVTRGVRGTPFVIDDGTGKALIDPRGAYIRVVYDHSVLDGAVERAKVADPDFLAGATGAGLQFEEGVLTLGEVVAVDGLIGDVGGDDPVYRRLADTRVRVTGARDRAAVVSELADDVGAGTRA